MSELLPTAAVGLVGIGMLTGAGWWILRRLRCSPWVNAVRELAADGLLMLAALRTGRPANHAALLAALRLSRAQRRLRRQIAEARRAGAYLGDVPDLMPRLVAEGHRLRTGLTEAVRGTATGDDLRARAERHLATLADLHDAIIATRALPSAAGTLADEAEDAARGLRLYVTAYTELTASPRANDQPVAPAVRRRQAA